MVSKNTGELSNKIERKNYPKKYTLYNVSLSKLQKQLTTARKGNGKKVINLPSPSGEFENFYFTEQSNFTNPSSKEYGFIKSYTIQSVKNSMLNGRISYGTDGVHVSTYSPKNGLYYIDPFNQSRTNYIAYHKSDLTKTKSKFRCHTENFKRITKIKQRKIAKKNAANGTLENYRLALACTDEYAQFHLKNQGISPNASDARKKAAVLSAMNTTITRVNEIYQRDLGIQLTIVLNENGENVLINLYEDSNTLSDSDTIVLLDQSQEICDKKIGNANYDIGHTFSTGAGGLALVGAVCQKGFKAKGVTGREDPINDPFDIEYVCHEIGHQFGANHTFSNSCDGNRSDKSAVEAASGSTIMSYAGVCSPSIQNTADSYFHSYSIKEILSYLNKVPSCSSAIKTNNSLPIANAGSDYSVPKSTPLLLKGSATDANNAGQLTYCWEQTDAGINITEPKTTDEKGPLFRSNPPITSPNRFLPELQTVINGNLSSKWEAIPSIKRDMNFSLTVRDNNINGGAIHTDYMKISVVDAKPFRVLSQNSSTTWNTGSNVSIKWDVGSTNTTPINCKHVKIKLSTDGGKNFNIILTEKTENDGEHTITVPTVITSEARIMVEAFDNIFYQVNATNFSIQSSKSTFVLNTPSSNQEACAKSGTSATFNITVSSINNFNNEIDFSIESLPEGVIPSFSPEKITGNGTVTLTLTKFENLKHGTYSIFVLGTSGEITQKTEVSLTISDDTFNKFNLLQPSNNALQTSVTPKLEWEEIKNTTQYKIELASDKAFTNIIQNLKSETNYIQLENVLEKSKTYFWRVKPVNNCYEGNYSEHYTFTTEAPQYCSSDYRNENTEYISNVSFNTLNNSSENSTSGYEDFTSISTTLIRGREYDINVSFNTAGFQDHCYVFIDWNQDFVFDKNTERYDLGILYTAPNQPSSPGPASMKIKVPSDAKIGNTRMRVIIEYTDSDNPAGDGSCDKDHKTEWGETEDYTLEIKKPSGDFSITNTSGNVSICNQSTNEQEFVIEYTPSEIFNETVSFSINGLPQNAIAGFSPEKINQKGNVKLTLSNLKNIKTGNYNISVEAKSDSINKRLPILLNINNGLCRAKGNENSRIRTTNVTLNEINNSSEKTNGYSDFTAKNTNLMIGKTYPLSIKANSDGNQTVETYVFIDWNQNCVLEPEETYNLGTVTNGNGLSSNSNFNVTVPTDAKSGTTTMRVITKIKESASPNPCQLDFDGEVEDYTITLQPDFILTSSRENISINKKETTSQSLVIDIKTINNFSEDITFSTPNLPSEIQSSFSKSVVNTTDRVTLTLSDLNNLKSGEYIIKISGTSKNITKSIDLLVIVTDGICKSYADNNSPLNIEKVIFNTINNSSSNKDGYADFTTTSTSITVGESYPITVTTTLENDKPVVAWIDWNQNTIFEAEEKYNLNTTKNITVPEDAKLGTTTLRIITKETRESISSCDYKFNGETEDYSIFIEKKQTTIGIIFEDLNVYPIPSDGNFNIDFTLKNKNVTSISVYDLNGRLLLTKKYPSFSSLFSEKLSLYNLASGLYFIEISNGDRKVSRKVIIK